LEYLLEKGNATNLPKWVNWWRWWESNPRPKNLPVESPTCVSGKLVPILFLIFTEPADSRCF